MRVIFFISAVLLAFSLHSQSFDWFANNPQWEVYHTAGIAGAKLETVTVSRDTVLGGRQAKIMNRDISFYNRISIAAQSGDSIFLWSHDEQQFHLLYNMAAPIGTSFTQPLTFSSNTTTYTVIDSGRVLLGSDHYRIQKWTNSNQSGEYLVIEGVGMAFYLTPGLDVLPTHFFWSEPDNPAPDGESWTLCNYKNDLIYYDPTPNADECFGLVDASDVLADVFDVRVAPNPAISDLVFEVKNDTESTYSLELFNLYGQRVYTSSFRSKMIIERASFSAGIYLFSLKNEEGKTVKTGKVMFVD